MSKSSRNILAHYTPLLLLVLLWAAAAGCFPATDVSTQPAQNTVADSPANSPAVSEQASPSGTGDQPAETLPPPTVRDIPTAPPAAEPTTRPLAGSEEGSNSQAAADASAPNSGTPDAGTPQEAATEEAATESLSPGSVPAIFEELDLLEDSAFGYLKELAEGLGPRTSSTDLEKEAAEYLMQRFEDLGYSPRLQEFSRASTRATVFVTTPSLGELESNTLDGAAPGEATARLAFVGLGKPGDIPEEGLAGKTALIERGEVTFGSKVAQVERAGAVAAIIFNNVDGNFRGTLGGNSRIPVVSLSRAHGLRLLESLNEGTAVEGTVVVAEDALPSRNVIAELAGAGEGVVVVGAHFDTVPDSVGASDNASGMGVLLTVAERVAEESFPFTIRFIAFGSEETGLHGSAYYVDSLPQEKLDEIYLMVNMDSVGSGTGLRISGDRWAIGHVREAAEQGEIRLAPTSRRGGGGSDHVNFRNAWVPVVFFLSDDLSRINTPADTMEHINPHLLGEAAALVLDLLANVDRLAGYGR